MPRNEDHGASGWSQTSLLGFSSPETHRDTLGLQPVTLGGRREQTRDANSEAPAQERHLKL